MLFNSQAWSNITDKNMTTITTIQLRYLKKMMGVRQATSNAFMYLELGILPIKYEIHKLQLSFLHHIINLSEDDPVKKVLRNQTALPEHNNWWHDVKKLMTKYSLEFDEEALIKISKEVYKKKVKKAVTEQALKDLVRENDNKKRTSSIKYDNLETQKYIKMMDTRSAKIIFKCRSKTLSIKQHMKYKFSDQSCRWCGIGEENLEHIVNCGREEQISNVDRTLQEMELYI